jgi:hypothetical protein
MRYFGAAQVNKKWFDAAHHDKRFVSAAFFMQKIHLASG